MEYDFTWSDIEGEQHNTWRCKTVKDLFVSLMSCNPQLVYFVEVNQHIIISEYMQVIFKFIEGIEFIVDESMKQEGESSEGVVLDIDIVEFETASEAYALASKYTSTHNTLLN